MIRTCKICGATSEKTAFYAKVNSRCAECHKAKVRQNRAENAERYKAYDAKRFQEDPRVKERHKKYQATDAGKASMETARAKWLRENEEKRAAHVILGNRLRDGKITKPDACEVCRATGVRIHGHHHDYSLPLDVKWLCPKCHTAEHRKEK